MADLKDVAVIGVGATKFGENYDWGVDDMLTIAGFKRWTTGV